MTVNVPLALLGSLLAAATVDGKTGVLTSSAWHARAADRLRSGGDWALWLVDLDRFATINSTHGHLAADEVLGGVAAVLRGAVGDQGVVGRFGGDEFVALVPAAARTADDVRAAVHGLEFAVAHPAGPRRIVDVSISVGVASGPAPDLTALLWAADAALYRAKGAGGNAVVDVAVSRPSH